ncbi:MAG: 30S ribosomal protein S5 [Thermoplasmata archaeon]|nr:30S ribosomal protein S5 [Thermoplasmata archaeon]
MDWEPKTELGRQVRDGNITTMHDALESRLSLREAEIVDILLPEMEDIVLDVNMVQRMTDSGRRVRFTVTVAVGNGDGYVGVASVKGHEVGPTIRKGIDRAKLCIIEVKRGCGSWECGCGEPHTVPFAVKGKSGSVEVYFRPAPRGVSLATGDIAKSILTLSGVKDVWGFTKGHTKTTINYANAVFDALKSTTTMRVTAGITDNLNIHTGISDVVPPAASFIDSKDMEKTAETPENTAPETTPVKEAAPEKDKEEAKTPPTPTEGGE